MPWNYRATLQTLDPAHTYVDAGVSVGPDTLIEPGCVFNAFADFGTVVLEGDASAGIATGLSPARDDLSAVDLFVRCQLRSE